MDYLLGWIVGLTVFFGIVVALFWAITRITRGMAGPSRRLERDLGLDVLRARRDRGEITDEEFEVGRRLLGSG
jgi:uncharacterized membrane protein